jgi:DGQHR domain-containing protein
MGKRYRAKGRDVGRSQRSITRDAVEIRQVPAIPVYLFTLTAHEILRVADISRIRRSPKGKLVGFQRPEARKHVQEITDYLNGDRPLFPHPIVLALPSTVKYRKKRGPKGGDRIASGGRLQIPLSDDNHRRPAWIVDGQQRALALSRSKNPNFPVPVAGFVAETVALQRDQFIRVNTTRRLSRRLVDELLPEVASPLPERLSARVLPSQLVNALNSDPRSPFQGLIARSSSSQHDAKRAVVTDSSLVNAIAESLKSGCLSIYRDSSGQYDQEAIWAILITYWTAVKEAFPEAWNKPQTQSRLMHAVGIRAMGRLMDQMMGSLDIGDPKTPSRIREGLKRVAPHCHWTSGRWEELGMDWDQLQVLSTHVNQLAHHLGRLYVLGGRRK